MLLILRHGSNKWIDELDVIHHIKIGIKMVLWVQRRQVCDGGRRTGTRRGLKGSRGRGLQVTRIGRRQGYVLQICGEGPSVASMASRGAWAMATGSGLIVAPWWTHFLLMTSILLLLLLVEAESESCVLFGGPIGSFCQCICTILIFFRYISSYFCDTLLRKSGTE